MHRFADQGVSGEMHHRFGILFRERLLDRLSIFEIALNELGAGVERAAMAFAQIIKDRDGVTFIEQKLGADASDVAGATDNENFHAPQNRRAARLINPKCDSMRFWPTPVSHSSASPMIDWNLKPLAWLRTDYFFEATQPSF